jgi:hypothetical protein
VAQYKRGSHSGHRLTEPLILYCRLSANQNDRNSLVTNFGIALSNLKQIVTQNHVCRYTSPFRCIAGPPLRTSKAPHHIAPSSPYFFHRTRHQISPIGQRPELFSLPLGLLLRMGLSRIFLATTNDGNACDRRLPRPTNLLKRRLLPFKLCTHVAPAEPVER